MSTTLKALAATLILTMTAALGVFVYTRPIGNERCFPFPPYDVWFCGGVEDD